MSAVVASVPAYRPMNRPSSPVVLDPLNALRMCRIDRGLRCRMVPSWNVYRTWSGRPDLLGHNKGGRKPSTINRPGMTDQRVAPVFKRRRFVHFNLVVAPDLWLKRELVPRLCGPLFRRRTTPCAGCENSEARSTVTILLPRPRVQARFRWSQRTVASGACDLDLPDFIVRLRTRGLLIATMGSVETPLLS